MTENNTSVTVSTETPVSTETTVKTVLAGLYGNVTFGKGGEMSGSFGTRESSGFDRLDRSAKLQVKKAVSARFDHLMRDGAFAHAQGIWNLLSTLSGSSETTRVVTESDVRTKMGEMVAMLRYAADAVFAGSVPVAGYDGLVPILDETDIPELSAEQCETALNRYATVRTGTKTKQHDIPDMIREAFESVESGTFFRISEIRARIAANHPESGISSEWDGRLNAALFGPNWDATYIQPVSSKSPEAFEYDEKGRAGAYRTDADIPDADAE